MLGAEKVGTVDSVNEWSGEDEQSASKRPHLSYRVIIGVAVLVYMDSSGGWVAPAYLLVKTSY